MANDDAIAQLFERLYRHLSEDSGFDVEAGWARLEQAIDEEQHG